MEVMIIFLIALNIFHTLVWFVIWRNNQKEKYQSDILTEATQRYNDIIHDAIEKANKLVEQAELTSINIGSLEKLEADKLLKTYQEHIQNLEDSVKQYVNATLTATQTSYQQYIASLEKKVSTDIEQNEAQIKQKTEALFQAIQHQVTTFVSNTQGKIQTELTQELANTRKAIDEYKAKKMQAVDENIIMILEKTIQVALGRSLSLKDQADLVYQSLNDAKKEQFFN